MSNFWTMCFPNAMCVPKSLVKILVSIGNVVRKRRVKATTFSSFGVRSHQQRVTPPVAGTGSAIYFVPPNRMILSRFLAGISLQRELIRIRRLPMARRDRKHITRSTSADGRPRGATRGPGRNGDPAERLPVKYRGELQAGAPGA